MDAAKTVTLTVDGRTASVPAGSTLLDAAHAVGVEIPTLCFLKELSPYGACGTCVVEVQGSPKLARACATKAADGMVVETRSPKALAARKFAVELLMGDHDADCRPPCTLECPAHTDCRLYVAQIAAGDYAGAVQTIRERISLPSSIGRVCPHPCETACRRALVEAPISIAKLKAFAADRVRVDGNAVPEAPAPATGKTVGIVGGGPAGLSAARRLALAGHAVTIYDQMPEMGGMLRWGIPAYRLPRAVLAAEVEEIRALGVAFVNGFKVGRDATLADLRSRHDALLVANGAWRSTPLGCPGETLAGVWGGIDFLRETASGGKPVLGSRVAVVGGGNTAMDACRTAVRLGAENVTVVYRRTRAEMPAERVEIEEAEAEGVTFKFLSAPVEAIGENGRVKALKVQTMRLGEPDERGRRRPEPVAGAYEEIPVDSVLVAVGQRNDPAGFESLPTTKRGTIVAYEKTFATSLDGVFAAGDAVNKGAGIAVGAIAQANDAADAIDAYLRGRAHVPVDPILSRRKATPADYADVPKRPRVEMPQRPAAERRNDFAAVDLGFSEEQARAEAKRCLSCGCREYGTCKLIQAANEVRADVAKFRGAFHPGFVERRLVAIERDQRKCILCNACVRTCDETVGKGILGLVGRGFETTIKPEFKDSAVVAGCATCHACVDACPTGALRILP